MYIYNEDMVKCNTRYYANTCTGDIAPGSHEMTASLKQSQCTTMMEHRTVGPVTVNPTAALPLYEGVGYGGNSTSSSLFYQYVPSKVRNASENISIELSITIDTFYCKHGHCFV